MVNHEYTYWILYLCITWTNLNISYSFRCVIGLCPDYETWDPRKPVPNAKEAMDAAEQWLDVPQVTIDSYFFCCRSGFGLSKLILAIRLLTRYYTRESVFLYRVCWRDLAVDLRYLSSSGSGGFSLPCVCEITGRTSMYWAGRAPLRILSVEMLVADSHNTTALRSQTCTM